MNGMDLVFRNYRPKSRCFAVSEDVLTLLQKVKSKMQEEKIDCELNDMVS